MRLWPSSSKFYFAVKYLRVLETRMSRVTLCILTFDARHNRDRANHQKTYIEATAHLRPPRDGLSHTSRHTSNLAGGEVAYDNQSPKLVDG